VADGANGAVPQQAVKATPESGVAAAAAVQSCYCLVAVGALGSNKPARLAHNAILGRDGSGAGKLALGVDSAEEKLISRNQAVITVSGRSGSVVFITVLGESPIRVAGQPMFKHQYRELFVGDVVELDYYRVDKSLGDTRYRFQMQAVSPQVHL
jgi:hypothetical protein